MEPFSTASAFIVTNIFILLFTLLSAPNRYFSTGMSPKNGMPLYCSTSISLSNVR